jgi:hypothetical protein
LLNQFSGAGLVLPARPAGSFTNERAPHSPCSHAAGAALLEVASADFDVMRQLST